MREISKELLLKRLDNKSTTTRDQWAAILSKAQELLRKYNLEFKHQNSGKELYSNSYDDPKIFKLSDPKNKMDAISGAAYVATLKNPTSIQELIVLDGFIRKSGIVLQDIDTKQSLGLKEQIDWCVIALLARSGFTNTPTYKELQNKRKDPEIIAKLIEILENRIDPDITSEHVLLVNIPDIIDYQAVAKAKNLTPQATINYYARVNNNLRNILNYPKKNFKAVKTLLPMRYYVNDSLDEQELVVIAQTRKAVTEKALLYLEKLGVTLKPGEKIELKKGRITFDRLLHTQANDELPTVVALAYLANKGPKYETLAIKIATSYVEKYPSKFDVSPDSILLNTAKKQLHESIIKILEHQNFSDIPDLKEIKNRLGEPEIFTSIVNFFEKNSKFTTEEIIFNIMPYITDTDVVEQYNESSRSLLSWIKTISNNPDTRIEPDNLFMPIEYFIHKMTGKNTTDKDKDYDEVEAKRTLENIATETVKRYGIFIRSNQSVKFGKGNLKDFKFPIKQDKLTIALACLSKNTDPISVNLSAGFARQYGIDNYEKIKRAPHIIWQNMLHNVGIEDFPLYPDDPITPEIKERLKSMLNEKLNTLRIKLNDNEYDSVFNILLSEEASDYIQVMQFQKILKLEYNIEERESLLTTLMVFPLNALYDNYQEYMDGVNLALENKLELEEIPKYSENFAADFEQAYKDKIVNDINKLTKEVRTKLNSYGIILSASNELRHTIAAIYKSDGGKQKVEKLIDGDYLHVKSFAARYAHKQIDRLELWHNIAKSNKDRGYKKYKEDQNWLKYECKALSHKIDGFLTTDLEDKDLIQSDVEHDIRYLFGDKLPAIIESFEGNPRSPFMILFKASKQRSLEALSYVINSSQIQALAYDELPLGDISFKKLDLSYFPFDNDKLSFVGTQFENCDFNNVEITNEILERLCFAEFDRCKGINYTAIYEKREQLKARFRVTGDLEQYNNLTIVDKVGVYATRDSNLRQYGSQDENIFIFETTEQPLKKYILDLNLANSGPYISSTPAILERIVESITIEQSIYDKPIQRKATIEDIFELIEPTQTKLRPMPEVEHHESRILNEVLTNLGLPRSTRYFVARGVGENKKIETEGKPPIIIRNISHPLLSYIEALRETTNLTEAKFYHQLSENTGLDKNLLIITLKNNPREITPKIALGIAEVLDLKEINKNYKMEEVTPTKQLLKSEFLLESPGAIFAKRVLRNMSLRQKYMKDEHGATGTIIENNPLRIKLYDKFLDDMQEQGFITDEDRKSITIEPTKGGNIRMSVEADDQKIIFRTTSAYMAQKVARIHSQQPGNPNIFPGG